MVTNILIDAIEYAQYHEVCSRLDLIANNHLLLPLFHSNCSFSFFYHSKILVVLQLQGNFYPYFPILSLLKKCTLQWGLTEGRIVLSLPSFILVPMAKYCESEGVFFHWPSSHNYIPGFKIAVLKMLWMVFNGDIYNCLIEKSFRLKSSSHSHSYI